MNKKLLFALIFPLVLFAQNQPKVGLVLSGGGAKGFAHIGVLRELEKAGVQVDYIGGTSMGAIIGGLYAVGYNSYQIEEIIKDTDFMSLLQDKVPRREKTYFEKAFVEKHAISLPFNKGTIGLPLGLSKGQNALNLLTELLSSVDDVNDFTKLPIPFYCIGTDIETGGEVLLEKGSLPLAIRASSSFPTLLNPVEIDNRLLVDGGVVNNFPVDIMKKKGVDIIIGVNVQGQLSNRNKLSSVTTILGQIINFQMYRKSDEQIKLVNIYMRPKVLEYTVTSFEDCEAIIAEGIKEAKPHKSTFENIAKQQIIKRELPKISQKVNEFLVDRIIINGNKNYTRNYILGKLQLKEGDYASYKDISRKINTLTATNNFERIDYHFEKSFKGKKLTLTIKEDKVKTYLRLGLHYDLLYESGILLNYNHKKVLFQNDELSADIVIGDNIRYDLQYFVDNGFLTSYGFSSRYNGFSSNILFNNNNVDRLNIEYKDFTNRLFMQTTIDKKFGFGFGLESKAIKAKTETILTNEGKETYLEKSHYLNSFVFLRLDTFNKTMFPTKGFYADVGFKWYMLSDRNDKLSQFLEGSNEPFNQFSQIGGKISAAFTLKDKLTFQYISEAGYTLGEEKSQVFDYRLGSYNKNFINNFISLYGYEIASLSDQSFLKSEFDIRYKVLDKHYATFTVNFGRVAENVFEKGSLFKDTKTGCALGYGVETLLGPIELKYSWSPDHSQKYWLFNLGFWF
ncbi:NTE family protein [Tenacibaculum adriaticum]|uniref:NTE family protein n=1 Tax=Tenacibaculum adriaticum TaxID=413713 RepID=A0A5S5DW28_9FLAO|nr:patatin-like phospholipase family protein [Tenacibaculum adriaticum]TYP99934.1 NTE family protein [Tenacibaculum adriaticum]